MCVCVRSCTHTQSSVLLVLLDHNDWMYSQDKCSRKWHPSSHFFCCLTIPYSFLTPSASFSFSVCPPPLASDLCSSLSVNEMELDLMWFGQSSFIWVCWAHDRLRWSEEQRWEIKRPPTAVSECRMLQCINGEEPSDHGQKWLRQWTRTV